MPASLMKSLELPGPTANPKDWNAEKFANTFTLSVIVDICETTARQTATFPVDEKDKTAIGSLDDEQVKNEIT